MPISWYYVFFSLTICNGQLSIAPGHSFHLHLTILMLILQELFFTFYIDIDLDVTTMRSHVKEVFTQNFELLQNTSRYSINSLADKMFTNSLISDDVHRSPKFQNIFDEFIAGMEVTTTPHATYIFAT